SSRTCKIATRNKNDSTLDRNSNKRNSTRPRPITTPNSNYWRPRFSSRDRKHTISDEWRHGSMATFENIFPTFLSKCGELHTLLQLVACVLFVVGVIVFVVNVFRRGQLFWYLTRLMVLSLLLVFLSALSNAFTVLLYNLIL